jgi:hypothetical protein
MRVALCMRVPTGQQQAQAIQQQLTQRGSLLSERLLSGRRG